MIATTCSGQLSPFVQHLPGLTDLSLLYDRYDNLTLRVSIASDMSRKLLNIRHQLCLALLGRGPTNTPSEENSLARNLPHERTQDQLVRFLRI